MSWSTFVRRNYWKIKRLGIDLNELNTVRFRIGETFEHRLVKFIICEYLFLLKHHFKTEQSVIHGVCDVIDLDTFVIYEVETNATKKVKENKLETFYHPLIEDIFIVNLKELKVDWSCFLKLSERIARHCGLKRRILRFGATQN